MEMGNLKELQFEFTDSTECTSEPSTSYAPDEGRGCRTKRKQVEPVFCPVCSVTVRQSELETHYISELTKLEKITQGTKSRKMSSTTASPQPTTETTSETPEKCWETYQNVKQNRQSRLKVKSRKRRNTDSSDPVCPVCNLNISGDLNQHVEDCLRKSENGHSSGEDEDVDIDIDVGGTDFEEYEWAGQHRVRASSMLEGGYTGMGIGTRITNPKNDTEEEDLVVDGDDSDKYGPSQYTERDIMLVNKNEDKDQTTLRLAIIGTSETGTTTTASLTEEVPDTEEVATMSSNPTVEALKARVRELEQSEINKQTYKCLICMGKYKTPVISICCWHVHCELCWLKTLGIKKLCPQCNMITSPTDLRKVFI